MYTKLINRKNFIITYHVKTHVYMIWEKKKNSYLQCVIFAGWLNTVKVSFPNHSWEYSLQLYATSSVVRGTQVSGFSCPSHDQLRGFMKYEWCFMPPRNLLCALKPLKSSKKYTNGVVQNVPNVQSLLKFNIDIIFF